MPNDVEFKTFHELLKAATRLPPLKIAAAMPRRSPSSTDRRRPPSKVFEVRSRVQVDLLLVPDLVSGNTFAKILNTWLKRRLEEWCSRPRADPPKAHLASAAIPVCCSTGNRLASHRGLSMTP